MGKFLCGLDRVKRFVKVDLHCIFRNLKNDKRNVDVDPLEKFLQMPIALRFCKNDSDSSLESLIVTRVESFCEKRDSSRVESPFFST